MMSYLLPFYFRGLLATKTGVIKFWGLHIYRDPFGTHYMHAWTERDLDEGIDEGTSVQKATQDIS